MRFKEVAVVFAFAGALGLLATAAAAAPKKKSQIEYDARGQTVFVSRDEEGRKRTRIIVQKRSYLNPGTETFSGEPSDHEYAFLPDQHATSVLDNTPFGNRGTLPGPFDLPSRGNPWLKF